MPSAGGTALHPEVNANVGLRRCKCSQAPPLRLDLSLTPEEFEAEFIAPPQCTSLADFLTRAPRGFQLMQNEEALRLVTRDVFEQLAADNVIYAEIRCAPLLHIEGGLSPEAVVSVVNEATEDRIRATGIRSPANPLFAAPLHV